MNSELRKYEIEGLVQEELIKSQDEAFQMLNEEGKVVPPQGNKPSKSPRLAEAIRHLLAEALLNEMPIPMGCNPIDDGTPMKYKKARNIIQMMNDLIWRLIDATRVPSINDDSVDPEIKTLMQQTYLPLLKLLAKKLVDAFNEQEPAAVPQEKEIVVSLVPNEIITSPQDKPYSVESIQGEKVFLKDIKEGTISKVDLGIAKKWKLSHSK